QASGRMFKVSEVSQRGSKLLRGCLQVLLRSCSDPSTRKQLISSYDMLTNPAKMGERFHFFGLLHHSRLAKLEKQEGLKLEKKRSPAQLPVAGFSELSFS
uniref:Uncharacterized protein n=1 Tax=Stegastes partitus TaxID=144197 RepID=A0A3B5BC65_9TELE